MFVSTSTETIGCYPFGMVMPGRSGSKAVCTKTTTTSTKPLIADYFDGSTDTWVATPGGTATTTGTELEITLGAQDTFSVPANASCIGSLKVTWLNTGAVAVINVFDNFGVPAIAPITVTTATTVTFSFTGTLTGGVYTITVTAVGLATPHCRLDSAEISGTVRITTVTCPEDGNYRYAFNGKEHDSEVSGTGNQYDYGFRVYNPRLGKFLSVDPLFQGYPWFTPYQFAGNRPIVALDVDGRENQDTNEDVSKSDANVNADVFTDIVNTVGTRAVHQVQQDETVWGIAQDLLGEDATNAEINELKNNILKWNGLTEETAEDIKPGQWLVTVDVEALLASNSSLEAEIQKMAADIKWYYENVDGGAEFVEQLFETNKNYAEILQFWIDTDAEVHGLLERLKDDIKWAGLSRVTRATSVLRLAKNTNLPRVLQSGSNVIKSGTLKALKLTKEQAKQAIETLKKQHGLPADHHGTIMSNGDYLGDGGKIGNIFDFL